MTALFLVGDIHERQTELIEAGEQFDLIITSPPFLALRDYLPADHPDKDKEIGSEATPAEYLDVLLQLTAQWRQLLAPHGSIAIELGDTYTGGGGWGDYPDDKNPRRTEFDGIRGGRRGMPGWPLDKSLTGIPTLYTWSLAYGRNLLTGQPSPAGQWRIRNLKPWIRTNPPVGSLGDKERPATSYITVATLARDRWFDLDAVRTTPSNPPRRDLSQNDIRRGRTPTEHRGPGKLGNYQSDEVTTRANPAGAPPLDWWHQVDAIIDNELRHGGSPWTNEKPLLSPEAAGGATPTATTKDAIFASPEIATAACGSSAANMPPTSVDALIDDELRRRADPPRATFGKTPWQEATGRGMDKGYDAERPGARGHHIRRALEKAGILTTLDALDISPKGYAGAHYAVWPPELVKQLVDEMCPRRVCTQCGEPSRRLIENSPEYQRAVGNQMAVCKAETSGSYQSNPGKLRRGQSGVTAGVKSVPYGKETLGWSDCGCPDPVRTRASSPDGGEDWPAQASMSGSMPAPGHSTKWRPGRILDPFVGSGTTLAVATGMARDAVGIDLDARNAHLAEQRVGMFLEVDWGHLEPTTELPPPEIVAAINEELL